MRLEETHLLKGHWKKSAYDLETASPHHIQNAVYHDCLVDFNHLEKYWSIGRIIPYNMEKMFQTTNQIGILSFWRWLYF
jgi:hypothetical protein